MKFLIILLLVLALIFSLTFRVIVTHPVQTVVNGCKDFARWLRFQQWNLMPTGQLIAFCGLFGKGKTLSAVHHVRQMYKKYNGKKVYDFGKKKWLKQNVLVISNVELTDIPYIPFTSLKQIVTVAESNRKFDDENDTMTCVLVLGDEFSVQMNSRSFKTNIDPLFLNTILTCRHHHISLIYTAQRFGHVDALLRQVTSYVVQCDKLWRIMRQKKYDAWELENANSPSMCKPIGRVGWFVSDTDYGAYDTLACVGNLVKSMEDGDMISETDILALQQLSPSDMDAVEHASRKFLRRQKKFKAS